MNTTTPTTAAAEPLRVRLGANPTGAPVFWHLTHADGRPRHGIIVGGTGSGGTTALAALGRSARAGGHHVVAIDLHNTAAGPFWEEAAHRTITDPAELAQDLDHALADRSPEPVGHTLLLVDDRGLEAAPDRWLALLRCADQLRVSVAVRVTSLSPAAFGGDPVRAYLAASAQWAALRHHGLHPARVARDVLEGYTGPRPGDLLPGQGLYGLDGRAVPVDVDAPDAGHRLRTVPPGQLAPTPIGYEVGAGRYPYRIDGRRLSQPEAVSVLQELDGTSPAEALHRLHLASTAAIRDAAPPRITCGFDGRYRIGDGPTQPRRMSYEDLVHNWRMTPDEAEAALEGAEENRLSA